MVISVCVVCVDVCNCYGVFYSVGSSVVSKLNVFISVDSVSGGIGVCSCLLSRMKSFLYIMVFIISRLLSSGCVVLLCGCRVMVSILVVVSLIVLSIVCLGCLFSSMIVISVDMIGSVLMMMFVFVVDVCCNLEMSSVVQFMLLVFVCMKSSV